MHFESDHIYHIYNRGNNSQTIFFNRDNYLFFLKKMRKHIVPHCDVISWCLMPTHFHLMVFVRSVDIEITQQVTPSQLLSRTRTFNDSISILLRSYTRAIQKQESRTGSLFQNRTKANCVTKVESLTPAWFQTNYRATINILDAEKEYPQMRFNYIHENPITDGIVQNMEDWEFSSYSDYVGLREGKLISKERADEFGLVI